MVNCFYTGLAVVYIIAVSVCGGSHRPDTVNNVVNTATDESSLKIPYWLRSAVASVKGLVPKNKVQEDNVHNYMNTQDGTLEAAEDVLPVLIHKEDEESSIKIAPSSLSEVDKVNPFFRSKRSTCTTPANLTAMVVNLNSQLTPSQLVGLNPGESPAPTLPANEPTSCPTSTTGSWWPRPEVNLRSTCPWKLQQVDLGVNAFPRYVNNAVCMCTESCIGSPSMRCMEVTYDVTYFLRQGCQNGLAVMETRKYTVNIGCHCVSALYQTTIPNYNSE